MINKYRLLKISTILGVLTPVAVANAQQFNNLVLILTSFFGLVNQAIIVGYALAFLALVWGVAKYIFSAGDEEAKGAGQRIMIGGVIGLFVITAVWGIVAFLVSSTGVDTKTPGTTGNFVARPAVS